MTIIGIVVQLCLGVFLFRYLRLLWYVRKIPTIPGSLPILGHLLPVLKKMKEEKTTMTSAAYLLLKDAFEMDNLRRKGTFKLFLGPIPMIVVFSPQMTQYLIQKKNIPKSFIYKALNFLMEGLVSLQTDDPKYRFHRKLLTPAFHFDILDSLGPIASSQTARMLSEIEYYLSDRKTDTVDDIEPFVARNTFRTLCESSMGSKLTHLSDEYFHNMVHSYNKMEEFLIDRVIQPWLLVDSLLPYYDQGRKCQKLLNDVIGFASDIFTSSLKTYQANKMNHQISKRKPSFVDILFREVEENPHHFTLKDAFGEFSVFLAAGFDTTTTAIIWTLLQVGHNSHVQKRIQEELDFVFGDIEVPQVSMSNVKKLNYLDAVVKESLRLMPSVPGFSRMINEDLTISMDDDEKVFLPKYTILGIVPILTHRMESHWPNPTDFDPERFLTSDRKRHPFAYLPFSAGARNCIGSRYALAQVKMVLSIILKKYQVTSLKAVNLVKTETLMVLKPKEKIPLKFMHRKSIGLCSH